jgi:hypothetical protein
MSLRINDTAISQGVSCVQVVSPRKQLPVSSPRPPRREECLCGKVILRCPGDPTCRLRRPPLSPMPPDGSVR